MIMEDKKNVRKKIVIKPGNITNEYIIYDKVFKIYAKFTSWKDVRKVEKGQFKILPEGELKIENVHFCAIRDQLEISIVAEKTKNPYIAEFDDFYLNKNKEEDVAVIQFYEGDIYKEITCFTIDDGQPRRVKGNILVGG